MKNFNLWEKLFVSKLSLYDRTIEDIINDFNYILIKNNKVYAKKYKSKKWKKVNILKKN